MQPTSAVGRTISPARRRSRGVTLVEMMVVMLIIAVIVSISTPSITAGIDAVRLATATSTVASFLNSAVNLAERRQRPVQLIVSPKENRIEFLSTEARSGRELTLPDGIFLEAVLPQALDDPESGRRLLLMPGGTAPAIGIQIANHHGGRRIVRLDPMTGFPRVENVENK